MAIVPLTPNVLNGGAGAAKAVALTGSLSVSDTYTFPAGNNVFLACRKSGAGACTVTAVTPNAVRGVALADPTYTVPATTGDVLIGPFPPDLFADANGNVTVSYSEITGLTHGAFILP